MRQVFQKGGDKVNNEHFPKTEEEKDAWYKQLPPAVRGVVDAFNELINGLTKNRMDHESDSDTHS